MITRLIAAAVAIPLLVAGRVAALEYILTRRHPYVTTIEMALLWATGGLVAGGIIIGLQTRRRYRREVIELEGGVEPGQGRLVMLSLFGPFALAPVLEILTAMAGHKFLSMYMPYPWFEGIFAVVLFTWLVLAVWYWGPSFLKRRGEDLDAL